MIPRVASAACVCAALLCAPSPVAAQAGKPSADARLTARDLDARARAAFDAGKFREAAEMFDRANRLVPHAATHFNGALAWDRAGELARAADGYETALGLEGLSTSMADTARDRLAVLKRQLGYIVVQSPIGSSVSVAHAKDVPIPANVHVPPGAHDVRIRARDGSVETEHVEVLAGATAIVKIVTKQAPIPPKDEPSKPPPPKPRQAEATGGGAGRTIGWIALGTGAALGIGAGVLGAKTLADRDRCDETLKRSDCDQARTTRLWTNIAAGAAVVSGGVGLYLLLSAGDEGRTPPAAAGLEIGPSGVRARVAF